MRNIFIINPNAGVGDMARFKYEIEDAARATGQICEVYITKGPADAISYIQRCCETKESNEVVRFFGIGGDGTMNEIANGVHGRKNAIAGIIPFGTGNDFIRNFGKAEDFIDIERQLNGTHRKVDLIRTTMYCGDDSIVRYCANMTNIGFDCNVVTAAAKIARKTVFKGSMAYLVGVIAMLAKMKGTNLHIETDKGEVFDGPILLSAIANGCYCGGGVKGVPLALTDDGLFDISIVCQLPRHSFLTLYPAYSKGTHLERKGIEDIITYRQCKSATITMNEGICDVCNDGEILKADKLFLETVPLAMDFNIPEGL